MSSSGISTTFQQPLFDIREATFLLYDLSVLITTLKKSVFKHGRVRISIGYRMSMTLKEDLVVICWLSIHLAGLLAGSLN